MPTNKDDDFSFERLRKDQLEVNLECANCKNELNECHVTDSNKIMDYVTFYCPRCGELIPYNPSYLYWTLIGA